MLRDTLLSFRQNAAHLCRPKGQVPIVTGDSRAEPDGVDLVFALFSISPEGLVNFNC